MGLLGVRKKEGGKLQCLQLCIGRYTACIVLVCGYTVAICAAVEDECYGWARGGDEVGKSCYAVERCGLFFGG